MRHLISKRSAATFMAAGALLLLGPGMASAQSGTVAPASGTATAVRSAVPATQPVDVTMAVPAAFPVNSTINFCNNTGGKIACFKANLHYVSVIRFQLRNVVLSDTLADNRAVTAQIWTQAGRIGGELQNNNGGGSSRTWKGPLTYTRGGGILYIHIRLFAHNWAGDSKSAWSKKHYNPYW